MYASTAEGLTRWTTAISPTAVTAPRSPAAFAFGEPLSVWGDALETVRVIIKGAGYRYVTVTGDLAYLIS
ncbi:MAG TPA: hypothetical protein VGO47_08530 [Chlamydiales bacterium]|nr:hypothetical protein [Chlamydiales bacterium]